MCNEVLSFIIAFVSMIKTQIRRHIVSTFPSYDFTFVFIPTKAIVYWNPDSTTEAPLYYKSHWHVCDNTQLCV